MKLSLSLFLKSGIVASSVLSVLAKLVPRLKMMLQGFLKKEKT